MQLPLTGGCLCGAIRYEISIPITQLRACNCKNCQRASGAGASVNAVVPSDKFKITRGTPRHFADGATQSGRTLSRYFCGDCGSPIYGERNPPPGFVVVRAGSLDDSTGMTIRTHIWTSSRRPWSHIDPVCEQHPGNMPPPPQKAN